MPRNSAEGEDEVGLSPCLNNFRVVCGSSWTSREIFVMLDIGQRWENLPRRRMQLDEL